MITSPKKIQDIDNDVILSQAVSEQDWEFLDADTQYLTHNMHRYSGKFIPQIANRAINLLTKPDEIVLDPYCGSGTVLVEAALMRRRGIGIDLNPLAVLIASAKITPISTSDLTKLKIKMAECVRELDANISLPLFSNYVLNDRNNEPKNIDPRLNDPWYSKWFQKDVLNDLVYIERTLQGISDINIRKVGWIAFSDILRKSSNAHSGYPNVMFDKNATNKRRPGLTFLKSLDRVCSMVGSLTEKKDANWNNVTVKAGNATELKLADCSIDAVITHQPYIGSIPYAEYGALSLTWLGHDPKELDRQLTGGRRQSMDVVKRFKLDFSKMISEAYRVLRPGRHAFLMVGNPVVRGEMIDLAQITIELGKNAGFTLETVAERQGTNRRANKMGNEKLIFLRKPPQ